jgi:hypothetical protein
MWRAVHQCVSFHVLAPQTGGQTPKMDNTTYVNETVPVDIGGGISELRAGTVLASRQSVVGLLGRLNHRSLRSNNLRTG